MEKLIVATFKMLCNGIDESSNKVSAQEFHDRIKAELWSVTKLDNKPVYMWRDAVYRWLRENSTLKSIETIKAHFRWLDPPLSNYQLHEITHEVLEEIALKKELQGVYTNYS